MTVENCKRLAKHCRSKGDEAGALMYEDRAQRKEAKYTREYLLKEAQRLQDMGKTEQAQAYLEKAYRKTEKEDKPEVKEDGKKPKG